MDTNANAKNKLDKTCHKQRGETIRKNEQVIVRHRSNWEAVVFRTNHGARLSVAWLDRRHGRVKTRKRQTKNAKEPQYHQMDWFHIRGCQASRSRQKKIKSYDIQRQSTLQTVIVKTDIISICCCMIHWSVYSVCLLYVLYFLRRKAVCIFHGSI